MITQQKNTLRQNKNVFINNYFMNRFLTNKVIKDQFIHDSVTADSVLNHKKYFIKESLQQCNVEMLGFDRKNRTCDSKNDAQLHLTCGLNLRLTDPFLL